MSEQTTTLPQTLKRWCCRYKSCGNTTLRLHSFTPDVAEGETPLPTLYRYLRQSNDETYGPFWTSEKALLEWVEETKDDLNPERG